MDCWREIFYGLDALPVTQPTETCLLCLYVNKFCCFSKSRLGYLCCTVPYTLEAAYVTSTYLPVNMWLKWDCGLQSTIPHVAVFLQPKGQRSTTQCKCQTVKQVTFEVTVTSAFFTVKKIAMHYGEMSSS